MLLFWLLSTYLTRQSKLNHVMLGEKPVRLIHPSLGVLISKSLSSLQSKVELQNVSFHLPSNIAKHLAMNSNSYASACLGTIMVVYQKSPYVWSDNRSLVSNWKVVWYIRINPLRNISFLTCNNIGHGWKKISFSWIDVHWKQNQWKQWEQKGKATERVFLIWLMVTKLLFFLTQHKSKVSSLDLTSCQGHVKAVKNLSQEIEIDLPWVEYKVRLLVLKILHSAFFQVGLR